MERWESKVVKVNSKDENEKIELMQYFGWSLKNREEVTYTYRDDEYENTLVTDHVALHFVRDINLPNLKEIKKIETEIFDIPHPEIPCLISYRRAMEIREKSLRRLRELSEQLSLLTRRKVRFSLIKRTKEPEGITDLVIGYLVVAAIIAVISAIVIGIIVELFH